MKAWFSLFFFICFVGCGKDAKEQLICLDGSTANVGVVLGPSTTGSAWVLESVDSVNQKRYYLTNLPEEYKTQNTTVNACLLPTDENLTCSCSNPPRLYRVVSIRRR